MWWRGIGDRMIRRGQALILSWEEMKKLQSFIALIQRAFTVQHQNKYVRPISMKNPREEFGQN